MPKLQLNEKILGIKFHSSVSGTYIWKWTESGSQILLWEGTWYHGFTSSILEGPRSGPGLIYTLLLNHPIPRPWVFIRRVFSMTLFKMHTVTISAKQQYLSNCMRFFIKVQDLYPDPRLGQWYFLIREKNPTKKFRLLIHNLGTIHEKSIRKNLQCRVRSRRGPPSRSRGGSWGRRSRLCRGCWAPACPPRWTPATQSKWSPVLRIRAVYPGSRIRGVYTGSRIRIFSIRIKEISILTQKIVSKLSEIWSGLFITDSDQDFYPSQIPDPGVKQTKRHRIPDPEHWWSPQETTFIVGERMRIPSLALLPSERGKLLYCTGFTDRSSTVKGGFQHRLLLNLIQTLDR